MREQLAADVLTSALTWLAEGGEVAIFDATNTTRDRRDRVIQRCHDFNPAVQVIFVESVCNDAKVLECNFMQKVTNSPDYKDMSLEEAMADLRKRIEKYESVYETIENDELSYIKLINMQSKVICNRIFGNMAHLLVPFLMSIHVIDRPIYLCRPAHFEKEVDSLSASLRDLSSIGDATNLVAKISEHGGKFAHALRELMLKETAGSPDAAHLTNLRVYTCTLPRALQTIAALGVNYRPMSALNNMDSGVYANMPLSEVRTQLTAEWSEFSRDPLNYRVHGGESLGDVIRRLASFVVELERQRTPTLVVSHLLNLQVLYGYLLGRTLKQCFETSIPLHVVVKLTPTQYGWSEERFDLREPEQLASEAGEHC
ncbi:TPA: hypothetical protein N0F65_005950 [Lagenidium giganteum]|uniref:6-phosphofructo-2-kinase domain-containing protein n=1 Tax=Lagenidium giganteum TaxID=4803 RepID=A0AAV2Z698_9STRA|nr:TPA: hypothetical protein N0F65_005950 [Lagenidium giganteum]